MATPEDGEGPETTNALPASYGQATATFVVISSMVGVGVLTTSGYTAHGVGSNAWMLGLWVVGAVIATCGALTLSELAAAIPKSGGDYVFLYEAYGPLAGFLSGWVSFLIGFGAPIAATAVASGDYLLRPFGLEESTAFYASRGLATFVILLFGHLHGRTRAGSIGAHGTATVVKLCLLATLAIAGIAAGWGRWENVADAPPLESVERGMIVAALSSLVYIYYSYTGWNAAAYLSGEVESPQKRLPRAIFTGIGVVVLLYLGLNLFYALALTPADLDLLPNLAPIAELASASLFGPRIAAGLSIVIGLTLLASLSAYILTGPRVAFAMARAGQFPTIAGRLSGPARTPAAATAMQISWSLVLLWTGTFEQIVVYAGVGLALFSMLTISSIYVLRVRRPDLPRPFRTPGYPVVPAIYLLSTSTLVTAAGINKPVEAILALASIGVGVPFYFGWRWLTGQSGGRPGPPPSTS